MQPICGSNGQTFPNSCHLQRFACLHKKNVTVAYEGECAEQPEVLDKGSDTLSSNRIASEKNGISKLLLKQLELTPSLFSDTLSESNLESGMFFLFKL